MTLEEIGKFIRYLRKSSKLTQEELSNRVNLNRRVLGGLERGNSNLQIYNLINFLDQFGYELSVVGKNENLDGDTDPIAIKVAEQIYNAVTLNFGHTRETKAKFGWVYIFKPVGKTKPIKIGYTQLDRPKNRLSVLNSDNPENYELFYAKLDIDCRYTEKSMFYLFEDKKINGEWYDADCYIAKDKLIEISNHSLEVECE